MQTVQVSLGARSYPILIGHGMMEDFGGAYVERGLGKSVAIVTNPTVAAHYLDPVKQSLEAAGVREETGLTSVAEDNLKWWKPGDEEAEHDPEALPLEGWTTEDSLINALTTRNAGGHAENPEQAEKMRQIEEDMVFLQLVGDEAAMEVIWSAVRQARGFPEVTGLAVMENARWMDFTRQARAMAASLYSRVLGEAGEDDDALER